MASLGLSRAVWCKSSRSNINGGACVEVSFVDALVAVRDSKNPSGPVLAFDADEWSAFLRRLG